MVWENRRKGKDLGGQEIEAYYNLQGILVAKSYNGVVVKVDTFDNGQKIVEKIVK